MRVYIINILLQALLLTQTTARATAKDAETEVKLQFLEYELEDFCLSKNEAEWKFLNGSHSDLKKLLEVELKESDFYKNELGLLQKHLGKKFAKEKLQRIADMFSHPGAPLLGEMEFKEYRDYSVKLDEMIGTMDIGCFNGKDNESDTGDSAVGKGSCLPLNRKKISKLLYTERDETKLKEMWIKWFREVEEKNKKTKYDFVQQLSILDLEAEQNGEEELAEYWLKQSDITWIDYDSVKNLWKEISPLYEKLRSYMMLLVEQSLGKNVLHDQKLIPVHILGSFESYDWITAAEKLNAFEQSDIYKATASFLKTKSIKDIYKMADNLTAEFKIGFLPQSFYEKSRFNETSKTCRNIVMNYCERENTIRVMSCDDQAPTVKNYIAINENVMKMKYLLLSGKEEEENGFLFREGPRDSVLYEAIESFSSLTALWPETWHKLNIVSNQTQERQELLNLFISALHVLPSLPYYLASDLWRINALKEIDAAVGESNVVDTTTAFTTSRNYHDVEKRQISNGNKDFENPIGHNPNGTAEESPTANNSSDKSSDVAKIYDTQNLTADWWKYRREFQGVDSPDGKYYEDYLQDLKIIWNKPYLSKFLGKILQFQILEYIKQENISVHTFNFQAFMQKGKSRSWQDLAEEMFNITEISAKPLLRYYKPLEEFLDQSIKHKNSRFGDFDSVSQSFSLNPISENGAGEKPAEGSDALFFSLAVIAAVGVVAMIVTYGRRRYKKKQRARERKRRLADL